MISEEEEDISEIVMVKYSTLGVVELIVVGVVGVIEKDTVPIERIWNEWEEKWEREREGIRDLDIIQSTM